ncbi:hflk [Desulfoluna butyratoxydans]|uniref:Protein HflK n=2 Tax=Desulfoluna butyratoxydans TaxID=231438 RepID=A0A4U8YI61_9BACT|nr:FtsH protease activity modulator HflK [Desulfoluna butyratoxydans]VFQ42904.1 hflk [Desulfoluna butyratoxydans]
MNWDWDKLREQQSQKKPFGGGGGSGGDGPNPPQLDDLMNQFKNFRLPGGLILIVLFLLFFGKSMIYTIGVGEVGVIQRFGQYSRQTLPGLHLKLPIGIEKLTKVNVDIIRKEEFGFTENQYSGRPGVTPRDDVSLMLTGDLNVGLVPWLVQYRIEDPVKYLFEVDQPESLLRDMAEASMRLVVGDRTINEVIIKRDEIAMAAKERLQTELNEAKTGITISTIEMKKTNVPGPVQPSFNEVNKAQQEKETMIYKAREAYNTAIPAARGEAERTIRAAEGYALDRINRAKGDASRFLSLYEEYAKAKDVTTRRIYLEKMGEILPKLGRKYIVDEKQQNLLPLLNMGPGKEAMSK